MLEEAAVLSRMSQSSIVSLLSLDSLPSYHYLVLEVRHRQRRGSETNLRGAVLCSAVGSVRFAEHVPRVSS